MALADYNKLSSRFKVAYAFKQRWLSLYQNSWSLVSPNRDALNVFFDYDDQGKPNTQQIWDDTAQTAAKQRANDLHSMLVPSDRVWGKITLNPHLVDQATIESMQPELDSINETIFWYINQSNLSRAANSALLDLNISTAGIWIESPSDTNPLVYTAMPGLCIIVEQTMDDVIRTAWNITKMTGRKILEVFKDYNGLQKQSLLDNPNNSFKVIYGQIWMPATNNYLIYATLDDDCDTPLFERLSDIRQGIIFRDQVRPGEADGRGVAIDFLPTISNLNQLVQSYIQSMAFRGNPPVFVDADQYFNQYSVSNWGGALFKRTPGRIPVQAMEFPEFPSVIQEIQYLTAKVENAFAVNPLGDISSPVRSAQEVSIRQDESQRTSQTDISRTVNEFPKPLFQISAELLEKRGLLPKLSALDPKVRKAITFEFVSPLEDIQDHEDLSNLETALQLIQQYLGEQALTMLVNTPNLTAFLTEKCNIPANLLKTSDQIKAAAQQMAKFQMAQQNPNGQGMGGGATPTTAAITPSQPQGLAA